MRSTRRLLAVLAVVAVLLAGWGDDDDNSNGNPAADDAELQPAHEVNAQEENSTDDSQSAPEIEL